MYPLTFNSLFLFSFLFWLFSGMIRILYPPLKLSASTLKRISLCSHLFNKSHTSYTFSFSRTTLQLAINFYYYSMNYKPCFHFAEDLQILQSNFLFVTTFPLLFYDVVWSPHRGEKCTHKLIATSDLYIQVFLQNHIQSIIIAQKINHNHAFLRNLYNYNTKDIGKYLLMSLYNQFLWNPLFCPQVTFLTRQESLFAIDIETINKPCLKYCKYI